MLLEEETIAIIQAQTIAVRSLLDEYKEVHQEIIEFSKKAIKELEELTQN